MALAVPSAQDGCENTLIVTITRNLRTVGKTSALKTELSAVGVSALPTTWGKWGLFSAVRAFLYYGFAELWNPTYCVRTGRAGGSYLSWLLIAAEGCQWGLDDRYWCSGLAWRCRLCTAPVGRGIPASCFVFAEPISECDNIWCKRTMRLRSHPLSECLSLKQRGLEQACWETGEGTAYGPSYFDTAEWLSLLLSLFLSVCLVFTCVCVCAEIELGKENLILSLTQTHALQKRTQPD